jgi:hypothetical protein
MSSFCSVRFHIKEHGFFVDTDSCYFLAECFFVHILPFCRLLLLEDSRSSGLFTFLLFRLNFSDTCSIKTSGFFHFNSVWFWFCITHSFFPVCKEHPFCLKFIFHAISAGTRCLSFNAKFSGVFVISFYGFLQCLWADIDYCTEASRLFSVIFTNFNEDLYWGTLYVRAHLWDFLLTLKLFTLSKWFLPCFCWVLRTLFRPFIFPFLFFWDFIHWSIVSERNYRVFCAVICFHYSVKTPCCGDHHFIFLIYW